MKKERNRKMKINIYMCRSRFLERQKKIVKNVQRIELVRNTGSLKDRPNGRL